MQGLARITAWLFVLSSVFPVAAGLLPSDPPRWLGVADVAVAAMLAGAAITLASRVGNVSEDTALASGYRLVRIVAYCIPLLLALFFVAGARINWQVMVIGLAWRAYLLVMVAPQLTRRSAS